MINKIIDGVIAKLDELYGDTYPYAREVSEQGVEDGSFFVKALKPSRKQIINTRGNEKYPIDIHFFNFEHIADAYDIASVLMANMTDIIVCGHIVHGSDIEYEVVDDVLHFFITYSLTTRREETPAENVQSVDINITTK